MRSPLTVFFSLLFFDVCSQTSLGIGIVWIDFDDKTVVELYDTPTDRNPVRKIVFFYDIQANSSSIRDFNKDKKWLKPELIWLEYSQFNFRCKSQNENWFEVIVNNEDGSTLWIKRNDESKFERWDEYLKHMYAVTRLNNKTQSIYESLSEDSKKIEYEGRDCFKVRNVKDEWIEIYSADYCDQKGRTIVKSGWVKWRSGDALLIKYYTTS